MGGVGEGLEVVRLVPDLDCYTGILGVALAKAHPRFRLIPRHRCVGPSPAPMQTKRYLIDQAANDRNII